MNPSSNNQGPIRGFNQNIYNAFLKEGQSQGQPYYNQLQQRESAGLANEINTRNQGYDIASNELQNQLGVDTRALNNQEGEKGTWGSSARNIRLGSLGTTYGNKFNELYNTTQGANTASLIGGEYAMGGNLSNLPQSNINRYNVSLSGSQPGAGAMGATASGSSGAKYNPFGFSGRNKADYETGARNYATDLYGRAFPNRRIQ